MCGIFGVIGHISERDALDCVNTLTHRGPDGYGLWRSDGITLGHRRLSILDLSETGSQPMSYAGGRYWITFNGEIYNFLELRSDLTKKGYAFRGESDTEVILASYVEWGAQCTDRFNGMWAFAIWDEQVKTLFLSRDRFGKKPLFYANVDGSFVFASEMKAIIPLLNDLRPAKFFRWMRDNPFLYEMTDRCLIEGIQRFPAAHSAYLRNGRLDFQRYWNTLDHLVVVPGKYEQQVEQFRELFIDACRVRMRSDVPIGTALSGGIDSTAVISTVAHVARCAGGDRLASDWQHAFVATFPGSPHDESSYAKIVVDKLGLNASFVEIDPVKSIDKLEYYLYLFEELYITSPVPMIQLYGAMKSGGVSVTLDGHGADELFGGYSQQLFEGSLGSGIGMKEITKIYREMVPSDPRQFRFIRSDLLLYLYFVARRVAKRVLGRELRSRDAAHPKFGALDRFNQYLYVLTHETILPTLLRNYDRYAMANGVEIRMPFMDHRLVAYSLSLPMRSKFGAGYTKKIVRDALARFMPEEIVNRKSKVGFNSPIVEWMQGGMRDYFLDLVNSQDFRTCALIDASRVKKRVEAVASGRENRFSFAERTWKYLVPYLWERAIMKRKYQSHQLQV